VKSFRSNYITTDDFRRRVANPPPKREIAQAPGSITAELCLLLPFIDDDRIIYIIFMVTDPLWNYLFIINIYQDEQTPKDNSVIIWKAESITVTLVMLHTFRNLAMAAPSRINPYRTIASPATTNISTRDIPAPPSEG